MGAAAGAGGGEGCDVGAGVGAGEGSGVEGGVAGGSQPGGDDERHHRGHDDQRHQGQTVGLEEELVSKMAVRGKPFSITTVMAPIPMADTGDGGQAGQMDRSNPAGGTEEHAREGRTASEAGSNSRVGQTLADEEQGEGTHRSSSPACSTRSAAPTGPRRGPREDGLTGDLRRKRRPGHRRPGRRAE